MISTPDGRPAPTVSVRTPLDLLWFDSMDGERSTIHVRSKDSGGAYSVMESVAAPGVATPVHSHGEDELFFILEGIVTFSIDGAVSTATPGTSVAIPAGVPHAWANRSAASIRMLATFTPGGPEELFERIAGQPPAEVARIAASYGTRVIGPSDV